MTKLAETSRKTTPNGPNGPNGRGKRPTTLRPVDVVLSTGVVATIRPVEPGDEDAIRALYERATPDSIHLRFFSASPATVEQDIKRMLRPASATHLTALATSDGEVIGIGCVEGTPHRTGDIALLVDDDRHGEGVGMLLIEHMVEAARRAGYRRIHADVLAENTPMLRVFRDLGADTASHLDAGVVEIDFPLSNDERWQRAVEWREATADHASISRVLAPRTVVVVGASPRPSSVGHRIIDDLVSGGYTGDLYAVNRSGEPIGDIPATTSIEALPLAPDLAIVAVPAKQVGQVISDCAEARVRAAVIVSDGFAELGEQGSEAQAEILRTARAAGMRIIGPNCLGVVNTDPNVRLNATFASLSPLPGDVGVASQSGGVGLAMLDCLARDRIGISTFVSLGNKADVSGNDMLMFWERDPATRICVLYLESFGNARKFARIASRVARTKPIIAITSGRSSAGARGVRSHTAAAATPTIAIDALFAQAGVIRAESMREATDIVTLLDRAPLPVGGRVAILTNGGGPGALAADACAAAGLQMPELSESLRASLATGLPGHASTANPIDTTAGGEPAVLAQAARTLMGSDEVDAIMVMHSSLSPVDTGELAAALEQVIEDCPDKPLVAIFVGKTLPEGVAPHLTAFDFPEPGARALAAVATYARWRAAAPAHPPKLTHIKRQAARRAVDRFLDAHPDGGWLDTDVAAELIADYGITVAQTRRASNADEAVAAARAVGYPVAVKSAAGEVLHRTDVGGVALDLRSDAHVRAAVADIEKSCGPDRPLAVQPMVPPGVETAVGIVNDPSVGPIVMFALGGVATDLLADRSFRLPPLGRTEVQQLVKSLRSSPLLFGYRGSPLVDVAALEDLLLRVSMLATDLPELTDLDLNPVIVSTEGAMAVDVKLRLARPAVIDPYVRRLAGGH
jgi:acyl-CoA synthetase (NDP forming)/GNAT superfamily N-acetyltransferase